MKYSLAVIALLGLSSDVEGVKVQHHHHHKHHFDNFLVELNGDADLTAAPKKATKVAAPVVAAKAPVPVAAAKTAAKAEPAAAAKPAAKAEPAAAPKDLTPPENRSNATYRKEAAADPEKMTDKK